MHKQSRPVKRRIILISCLAAAALACYAGLIALVYHWEVSVPQPSGYDGIIVLGAQVLPTGEPSVQLRWRLDKAIECYRAAPCYIVVCGGQGPNEPEPEGDVMRRVLLQEGLAREHVISDPVSANTRQNIANAWEILQGLGCERPLIVTSDYHLPRALALARDAGLEAQGVGSPCRAGVRFFLKNHMREALAWVKYWGVKYLKLPL